MRLSELAWNFMALDEKLIGMTVAFEARHGRKISCQKGCAACCRHLIPLSPSEAWLLYDFVASFPADRKLAVLERIARSKERLKQEGFDRRFLHSMAGKDELQAAGLDYFRLGLACPFLEEESCAIYPFRPTSCREYLVTTPASYCADPGLNPVRLVPLAISLTEVFARLAAVLLGWEPKVIPLVLALDWAEEHLEEGRRRYDPVSLITLLVETLSNVGSKDEPDQ
ncbi:MAG: YkgJ family cysteine cluster protein, partial [Acidobacteriota bacterium]